jgi:hypothetical protein
METELVLVFELKLEEIICGVVSGMATEISTSEILYHIIKSVYIERYTEKF